ITEVMQEHGIGVEATTWHRMLGVSRNGHDQKGWGFMHNATFPLRKRFIFGDESSMNDCDIMAAVTAALLPGTHVLWIGDFAQLPPVGHGAPLRDMIAAGLPYGELTEIHRNEGAIVRACRDVKEGRPFQPCDAPNTAAGDNLWHIEASRPSLAVNTLGRMLRNVPAGIDPLWDVQVLCATNESSDVSRKPLNKMIQDILNPDGDHIDGNRFRLGDKVICLTNSELPLLRCPKPECGCPTASVTFERGTFSCGHCFHDWKIGECLGDFVANGEIGRVVSIESHAMHVAFDSPRRTVRVAGEWLQQFDLAYAITTHKAQGSQCQVIICMADDSRAADMVTSWEWWRTAWSRAEQLCITIGKKSTIDRQCKVSALAHRKTFLRELLEAA
ncbi:MAG TPA: ATP-dependent RecD-like DNA helicase, partial [Pirellulales bacterium]|nr:ATP-dependent RecD-like DNA helicase [Pirellulales bacterium]